MKRLRTTVACVAALAALAITAKADPAYTVVAGGLSSRAGSRSRRRPPLRRAGGIGRRHRQDHRDRSAGTRNDAFAMLLPDCLEGADGEFVGVDGLWSRSVTSGDHGRFGSRRADHRCRHLLKFNPARHRGSPNVGNYNYAWTGSTWTWPMVIFRLESYGVPPCQAAATSPTPREQRSTSSPPTAGFRSGLLPDNAIRDATPTCIAPRTGRALYVGTLALSTASCWVPARSSDASIVRDQSDDSHRAEPRHAVGDGLYRSTLRSVRTGTLLRVAALHAVAAAISAGDVVKIRSRRRCTSFLTAGALTVPGGVAIGRRRSLRVQFRGLRWSD